MQYLFWANRGRTAEEKQAAAQWYKEELGFFTLYLNFAVNNIAAAVGKLEGFEPEKIAEQLKGKGAVLGKLAHFLWLFKVENPSRDYKDWEAMTISLVKKIYELRNLFTHPENSENAGAFLTGQQLYVLLEGLLKNLARHAALKHGLRVDKLSKLKLLNLHGECDGKTPAEERKYEFTRKGLIFLVCLALYKDEAEEFCMLFHDMRTVQVECKGEPPFMRDILPMKSKPLVALFTEFSQRRGRSNIDMQDADFLSFSDISGYLNKVPLTSYNFLSLDGEKKRLAELIAVSEESEENKRDKYRLHRRKKERFLSFCAAFCEDFDVFPFLHFKRLDITPGPGRTQYLFGKEADNRVRQDRHYVTRNNALHFEFRPKKHYGSIHIDSLRSQVGEGELKRLLALRCLPSSKLKADTEKNVERYFTAWHRILETVLNAPSVHSTSYLEGIKDDLALISGQDAQAIMNNPALLDGVLPQSIWRLFLHAEMRPGLSELRDTLMRKMQTSIDHGVDFLKRAEVFVQWVNQKQEERSKFPPVCSVEQVWQPPRECRIADSEKVQAVFNYLNLFLEDDRKFRQLPLGEQHRKNGCDYEYQIVHALIGKFSLDQMSLWSFLTRRRPELRLQIERLKERVRKISTQEGRRYPKYDPRTGRPLKSLTLLHLAMAATDLKLDELESRGDRWVDASARQLSARQDELVRECRRFGIKPGMPLDRASVLKSILRLDEAQWKRAYDYEAQKPYENRLLEEEGHIVSQIPFPNGMAERILKAAPKMHQELYQKVRMKDGSLGSVFNFSEAIRLWSSNMTPTSLRDFYDIKPLLAYLKKNKGKLKREFIFGTDGVQMPDEDYAPLYDFSKAGVTKAIIDIKNTHCQDMLLLAMAFQYKTRYLQRSATVASKKIEIRRENSVYDWFTAEIPVPVSVKGFGNMKIIARPHDLSRFVFAHIQQKEIWESLVSHFEEGRQEFHFYELMTMYREIQAKDRRCRMDLIGKIFQVEKKANVHPNVYKELPNESHEDTQARIYRQEFKCYHRAFPAMDEADYDCLRSVRNKIMHNGFDLDVSAAEAVFMKIGI